MKLLMEYGCVDFREICDWCKYLDAKGHDANFLFPAETVEQVRERMLSTIARGDHFYLSDSEKRSIYRSMRELEKRDLVARLLHQKPTVWTWIDYRSGKPRLGFTHETGPFHSESKQWGKDVWRSKKWQFGKPAQLSPKELKQKIRYYDKLSEKAMYGYVHYKVEAKKRGILKDDKWIDE